MSKPVGSKPFGAVRVCALAIAVGLLLSPPAWAKSTLEQVVERGYVRCGVNPEMGGPLTALDHDGRWSGFYVEFCRAIAAAVTGDAENVDYVLSPSSIRFDNLRHGLIDVLSEASTWTMERDLAGLEFAAITAHDGQGFMVHESDRVETVADLAGKVVCVPQQATSYHTLVDFIRASGIDLTLLPFSTLEGAFHAFFERQCTAVSTDSQILASVRLSLAAAPKEYHILDTRLSHEPLGLVVRDDDPTWAYVVRWSLYAMIRAEDLGISSTTVEALEDRESLEIRRLLGLEGHLPDSFPLPADWARNIIRQVGNYGEVYARTLGPGTPFDMERGRNALIRDGGLMWAPPLR